MNYLVLWDKVKQAIEEAHGIDELKNIRDQAEAYRYAMKLAGEAPAVVRKAEEIKIRAERRAGEILKTMVKAKGAIEPGTKRGTTQSEGKTASTYADQGIDKRDASMWQKIADIPEEKFEQYIATAPEITTAGAVRLARADARYSKETPKMKVGRYRILYADPPWSYGENGISGVTALDSYGTVDKHYKSQMTIDEICEMELPEIEDNAVLFLWVTSAFLEISFKVIQEWGFNYKTSFIWDKIKHNYGFYNSVRHEILLIATRGSCRPDDKHLIDSVQTIERSDRHSEKPEEFRQIIDSLYTEGNRIELFARKKSNEIISSKKWETWGNEI
jgi:N6-adenosine-specific RNA methylase IME4